MTDNRTLDALLYIAERARAGLEVIKQHPDTDGATALRDIALKAEDFVGERRDEAQERAA